MIVGSKYLCLTWRWNCVHHWVANIWISPFPRISVSSDDCPQLHTSHRVLGPRGQYTDMSKLFMVCFHLICGVLQIVLVICLIKSWSDGNITCQGFPSVHFFARLEQSWGFETQSAIQFIIDMRGQSSLATKFMVVKGCNVSRHMLVCHVRRFGHVMKVRHKGAQRAKIAQNCHRTESFFENMCATLNALKKSRQL